MAKKRKANWKIINRVRREKRAKRDPQGQLYRHIEGGVYLK